jgi:hypothetical protein
MTTWKRYTPVITWLNTWAPGQWVVVQGSQLNPATDNRCGVVDAVMLLMQ